MLIIAYTVQNITWRPATRKTAIPSYHNNSKSGFQLHIFMSTPACSRRLPHCLANAFHHPLVAAYSEDRTQCEPNPITNSMHSNPMVPRPSRCAPFSVSPTSVRQLCHVDRGNARKTSDLPPLNGPQELNTRPPDMMRPGLASSTNIALAGGLSANGGPYSAGKSFQPQIWPSQRRHRSQG